MVRPDMTPRERPSLQSDAKANAFQQLREELQLAIDRSQLDVAEAKKGLEEAEEALKMAEATRED